MKINLKILLFFLTFCSIAYTQQKDPMNEQEYLTKLNHYDFADIFKPYVDVKVWGVIKNPGIYRINKDTRLLELLSYTGGIKEDVDFEGIRIIRYKDSVSTKVEELITINYEEIFEANDISGKNITNPELKNGDIIITMKRKTWYTEIQPAVSILSLLTSLATMVYIIVTRTGN